MTSLPASLRATSLLAVVTTTMLLGRGTAHGAPLVVPSQLKAVTVYGDRAVLTRSARADIPAGTSELVLAALPAALMDESLQVSGRGLAGVTLLDVNARVTFVETTPDPRLRTLEDDLATLRREDTALAARLAQVDQQRALLQKIETAMTAPPPRDAVSTVSRPSFEEWQKLLAFQADNLGRLAAEQQGLQRQRSELAARIAAAEAQLNEVRGRGTARRSQKTVTIRVAAERAGTLDLTATYAVPGASWAPAYDARLRSEARSIDLTYYGVIRNATGEDWSNLALTLSTARPALGGGAPELAPWIVDIARPLPAPMDAVQLSEFRVEAKPRSRAATKSALAGAPEAAAAPPPLELAQASVEAGATSATFRVETPVTLPSDGSTQKVAILATRLPATLRYETTPKAMEAAFLNASALNGSEYPLLAGTVNAFLDDTFVASSHLKAVMPGERFDLALGADEAIAVKRRVVNRFTEDTGLTNRGRRITYEFLITLTNNKKSPERILLREGVPVSRDEKIVVKLLTPAERDIGAAEGQKEITREPEGRLAWRIDLKPGEKREIPVKLSVEHPGDLAVTGVE
ncbi:MAG: mucoidy inhibitor MuiA family protein [Opitutaceae bacterium]|nr:mucoidy inhibitor MuiA family protein [Opitutaceae bacterium]